MLFTSFRGREVDVDKVELISVSVALSDYRSISSLLWMDC